MDYHHIFRAREAIASWFSDRDGSARIDILKCLTQPSDRGANVRVIWYELGEEQDPRAVFIRLNVGRIPLTSAELIQALLLRGDGATDEEVHRRHRVAQDWDLVEKRLHDPEYWFFPQSGAPDHDPPARIECLFDIFVRVHQPGLADHPDDLATFFAFQTWLDAQRQATYASWLTFRRQTAQVLEEWFENRVLFHLVGALVAVAPGGRAKSGLAPAGSPAEHLWERALLTKGDYLLRRGQNFSLLDDLDRDASWRRLLRADTKLDDRERRRDVARSVLERLDPADPEASLRSVIAEGLEDGAEA